MKKFVAWLLVCLMIVSSLPLAAFAEAEAAKCPGADIVHTLDNCDWERLTEDLPACGEGGEVGYRCKGCGEGFIITVIANSEECEYTVVEAEAVEPVCDPDPTKCKDGKKAIIKCAKCGNIDPDNAGQTIPWSHTFEGVDGAISPVDDKLYYGKHVCECGAETYEDNTDDPSVLKHNWKKTPILVTPSTCAEAGKAIYGCEDCDATKEVEMTSKCDVSALEFHEEKKATCTEQGNVAYYECLTCGQKYQTDKVTKTNSVIIRPYDHGSGKKDEESIHINHFADTSSQCADSEYDWVLTDKEPTNPNKCSVYTRKCEYCAEIEVDYTIEWEVGHDINEITNENPVNVVTTPGCFEGEGISKKLCKRCNKEVQFATQPVGYHDWKVVEGTETLDLNLIAPTCTDTGIATLFCNKCKAYFGAGYADANLNDNGTAKNPKLYGAGKVDANLDGAITDADKVNGEFLVCDANGKIAALGHNTFKNGTDKVTNNKCVSGATQTWTCGRNGCKVALSENIEATGHAEFTVTVNGFCAGKTYTFTYCANDYCEVYALKTEWKDEADNNKSYSLTKAYDNVTALVGVGAENATNTIGDTGVRLIGDVALGNVVSHDSFTFDWDEYAAGPDAYKTKYFWFAQPGEGALVVEAPNCTTAGSYKYACSKCPENIDKEIPALNHDFSEGATVSQIANDATYHQVECKRDGCTAKSNVAHTWNTEATGADANGWVSVENCDDGKYQYRTCSVCQFVEKTEVTAIDPNKEYANLAAADKVHGTLTLTPLKKFDCGTANEFIVYLCEDCGVNVRVSVPAEHKYAVSVEDAECEVKYDCQNPTCSHTGEKADLLKSHRWGTELALKLPTCGAEAEAGHLAYAPCANEGCNYIRYFDADTKTYVVTNNKAEVTIAALVHKVVLADSRNQDCTDFGYKHYACAYCTEDERIEEFVAAAHVNSLGEKFTSLCDTTVTDDNYDCVVCSGTEVAVHTEGLYINVPDTCYQDGYKGFICMTCEKLQITDVLDEIGEGEHIYGAYKTDDGYALTGDAADFEVGAWAITTAPDAETGNAGVKEQICKFHKEGYCDAAKKTVVAAAEIQYALSASNKYGDYNLAQGSLIAVVLSVKSNGAEFAGNYVTVNYDNSKVAFVDWDNLSDDFNTLATANGKNTTGVLKYVSMTATNDADETVNAKVDGEQELAVFYFRIVGGANAENAFQFTAGSTEFFIDNDETFAANKDGVTDATVVEFIMAEDHVDIADEDAVEWTVFLDLNGDTNVDINDVMQAFPFMQEGEYDARIDINKDGFITIADAQLITDYIVGSVDAWDMFAAGLSAVELASLINLQNSIF